MKKTIIILSAVAVVMLLVVALLLLTGGEEAKPAPTTTVATTEEPTTQTTVPPTTLPPETEPPETEPPFQPHMTATSDPALWNTVWEVLVDKEVVESYTREQPITFEDDNYFAVPGVASFRGGNYRADASYGTADITEKTINQIWSMNVGFLSDPEWVGCGWTGQPLVVQWDAQTREHMNLYEDKKNKEGLVEVVYAKMDGRVHFFDIEDGSATRDPIKLGMVFKGSGALDPRGYPLLYVGAGLQQGSKLQTIFVVSLIDGSILYEYCGRDGTAYRLWSAFDSSPLVDAETDTLIWPCESGQIYTFKLNTEYDQENGTITVNPDAPVKSRYTNDYYKEGRYIGYESSPNMVDNYLYIGDNAGAFHCVDINTMELVWAQDILDDVNATAAFEWGDDHRGYLYIGPSKDYSAKGNTADLPICKLDAQTGEILWTKIVNCGTYDGCAGGTMGSPMLGREGSNIEDLVIFAMARTPGAWDSVVYALDKNTGEVVWEYETGSYTWCSPVGIYSEDGTGYVFQIDNEGMCYLIDGATGKVESTYNMKVHVEASPVVYNDRVVIGTRFGVVLFDIN